MMHSVAAQRLPFADAASLLAPSVGSKYGLNQREVDLNLRLHFPRTASSSGVVEMSWAMKEAERVAEKMRVKRSAAQNLLALHTSSQANLKNLDVCRITEAAGKLVSENFHYIGVCRSRSEHWALYDPRSESIYTYCCVSPVGFDGKRQSIANTLECQTGDIAMISRVYSFPPGLQNSISYLLSRVIKKSSMIARTKWIVTTVDPNLGFTGSSYAACNWKRLQRLPAQPYTYIAGDFVTHAQLALKFDTTDYSALEARLGGKFESSRCSLQGQILFGYPVRQRKRVDAQCF